MVPFYAAFTIWLEVIQSWLQLQEALVSAVPRGMGLILKMTPKCFASVVPNEEVHGGGDKQFL